MFAPDGSFFYRDLKTESFVWVDLENYKELRVSTPDDYNFGQDWWVGADGAPQSNYNLSGSGYATSIAAEGPNEILGLTNDIQALSWLDSTRALAVGRAEGGGGAVGRGPLGTFNAHVKQADGQSPSGRFKAITPQSDFTITSAVGDEKDEIIYFTAARGQEGYLFSVPADGSAEPKRIGLVKGGGTLIDFASPNSPAVSKPTSSAAPKANPKDFLGTWSGPVKGDSSIYDVVAVISETNGALTATVKYPQLDCQATWKELGSDSDGMRLQETLISGRCAQGVKIRLAKSGTQILAEFNGTQITSTMDPS
jgi:hypothetical protein